MKKLISLFLALTLILSMSACSPTQTNVGSGGENQGSGEEKDTIAFAVCGPMTGDNAEYGLAFRQAAQCQADKWNEKGGLLGKQIKLIVYDDKGSPEEAANIGQQIVSNKEITAVIGHFTSSCSMAAAPIYQENSMLEISPTSSHADYPKIGDWMFRTTQRPHEEEYSLCDYIIHNVPDVKKIGILILNNDWGIQSAEIAEKVLNEYAAAEGKKIEIFKEKVVEGSDDYSSVVTNFKNAGIDTIYNCSTYTVAVPFLNQLKTAMPEVRVFTHFNTMVPQMTEVLGEKAVGIVATAIFASFYSDPLVQEFVEHFKSMDAKNREPIPDSALYYDASGILFSAVEKAESEDREKIREALKTMEYNGVTGLLKFDENRECPRSCRYVVIDKDLKWSELK